MRVCAYEVIGHHVGGYLPSTTFKEEFEDEESPRQSKTPKKVSKPKDGSTPAVKKAVDSDLFKQMDAEDSKTLMGRDIATLRRYAALHLKIVGASKLLGGKAMLVNRILSIRN
jgi:hypothetical protein